MKRLIQIAAMSCVLACSAGCGSTPQPAAPETTPKPSAPVVPPEIQAAAAAVLGSEAEVLEFGDLANTGAQQVLVINRIKKTPPNTVPGILITRGAILSKEDGKWKELLHVDEHLKNTSGYLAATPISPVSGWRLQYEKDASKGLELYFTPLEKPRGGNIQTIGVRWNDKAKRYQSLDRTYERFLGETPAIEKLNSYLR